MIYHVNEIQFDSDSGVYILQIERGMENTSAFAAGGCYPLTRLDLSKNTWWLKNQKADLLLKSKIGAKLCTVDVGHAQETQFIFATQKLR